MSLSDAISSRRYSPNYYLAHEVNANMVFKWRRQYRAGLFGADAEPTFLPVTLTTAPEREPAAPQAATPADTGIIEIEIGDAVVRLHGAVNAKTLRAVIQSLRA